jgi:hypothetical protein
MNPEFIASNTEVSDLNPPEPFDIDEINRTIADRHDWSTIRFVLQVDSAAASTSPGVSTQKHLLNTCEVLLAATTTILQARAGLLIVESAESIKSSSPVGVFQIALTAYSVEVNGEKILVMRRYGLKRMESVLFKREGYYRVDGFSAGGEG